MRRTLPGLAVLVIVLGAVMAAGCADKASAFSGDIYSFVGETPSGVSVYLTDTPSRMVVQLSNEKEPRLFWGADVLKDGTILLTDLEKGLVAIRPSGIEETLIAPPGAGSVVRVDPSQRCAAFTCPVESLGDVEVTVGIGLLDLEGDKEPRLILGPQPGKGSPGHPG